ncbi:glycosyltransferase family 4 protein [bacterium]|nr:glycosyltransferase family 4 protein [bacterium]
MVKVIHVITRLDEGGSSAVTLELANGLEQEGFNNKIIFGKTLVPQVNFVEFTQKTGIDLLEVPELVREVSVWKDFVAFVKILKIVIKEKPKIVHTHTSKAGIIGRLAGFFAKVPVIVHTPHGHIFYGYFGKFRTKFFILLERLLAGVTDKITNLTELEKQDHVNEKIAKPEKFVPIYCGIFLSEFKSCKETKIRAEFGISGDTFLVGFVGRLVEIKGCDIFLRGAEVFGKKFDDVKFLIVGDGELRQDLENLAKELGIAEKVIFTGTRKDIPQIFHALDVFVLTSRNEGLGRVLIEAMVSGIPIVASKVGGVSEVLENGKNGLLFSSENFNELSENLVKLKAGKNLRQTLIENGKVRAEGFEMATMIQRVKNLYNELL